MAIVIACHKVARWIDLITMHAYLDSEMHKLKLAQNATISIIRAVETCAKNV